MKYLAIIIALAAAMLGYGRAQAAGGVKDYCVEIGDFTEITVANSVNVVYKWNPDSAGMAKYSCRPEIADAFVFNNPKHKLKVEIDSEKPVEGPLPTITVYSMALVSATNWGDSTLVVESINPGAKFKAKVIGNGAIDVNNVRTTQLSASVSAGMGHIFITGKAQQASYSIVSAGAIEAGGLEASKVTCKVYGTGSIDCRPSSRLKVTGTGPGKVFYIGDPEVKNYGVKIPVVQLEN